MPNKAWVDLDLAGTKSDVNTQVDRDAPHRKRVGLGRGLSDLLPGIENRRVPTYFQPGSGQQLSIKRVTVIESATSVIVEIESLAGVMYVESVDCEIDIEEAVLKGVCSLLEIPDEVALHSSELISHDGLVLLVTGQINGARCVGAAIVEHDRPYALARAAVSCLQAL